MKSRRQAVGAGVTSIPVSRLRIYLPNSAAASVRSGGARLHSSRNMVYNRDVRQDNIKQSAIAEKNVDIRFS